jgi:hypothetical protein
MHRYKELADALSLSVLALEKEIGVPTTTMNKAIKRGSKVSMDIATKIMDKYPHISREWILKGVGSMFTAPQVPATEDEGWERVTDMPGYLLSSSDIAEFSNLKKQLEGRNVYEVLAQLYIRIDELERKLYNK